MPYFNLTSDSSFDDLINSSFPDINENNCQPIVDSKPQQQILQDSEVVKFVANSEDVSKQTNIKWSKSGRSKGRRFKSEMCRMWTEWAYCSFGDRCMFAHGIHEMSSVRRHPNYRSRICTSYNYDGYCPFGNRCDFIHIHNDPIKLMEQTIKAVGQIPAPLSYNTIQSNDQLFYRNIDSDLIGDMFSLPTQPIVDHNSRLKIFEKISGTNGQ
ncbi:uncharacterized protein LOC128958201 [Oppia nitens]|uniref:uncharacterized protein LOC128958201 n=1 Tax=Oppia nitens TaxID=1686743 RepID=UPI0023DC48CB|nr:uncharacterized protein LOC128958201 [Oppia nitens]